MDENFSVRLTPDQIRDSPKETAAELERQTVENLYRATLQVQNGLFADALDGYLDTLPQWQQAASVLDLGCGPGDLTGHLARRFPRKRFTGVDLNAGFIAAARDLTEELGNCSFREGDILECKDLRADFIVMRAVLQHLKEPDRFMRRLPGLLNPGGTVLFLETTRENFVISEPPIPSFDRFYTQVEMMQKQQGGNRDCIAELEARLGEYAFRVLESAWPVLEVDTSERRRQLVQYLSLACALLKKMVPVALELPDLFAELAAWHEARDSRARLLSRRLLLECTSGKPSSWGDEKGPAFASPW